MARYVLALLDEFAAMRSDDFNRFVQVGARASKPEVLDTGTDARPIARRGVFVEGDEIRVPGVFRNTM